ncbi:hypothetical protein GGR02_003444 [Anoxybacillus voinovskiensis]|uniref:Uncharacterized protein n=1 Tax=Anoxybacteroides voinovskiense TaxID=230470 RepID=A0A840DVM5_9BACL|nr:hypothetical protein [Anoxybacillus voinovskiensis]MBB4075592.1 hypothetical protein [Anoxybacillus voinovskiensis]GGJ80294.1 hypothetical protein GCM10008982_32260 [Anoxybacillus voinovskiensis]
MSLFRELGRLAGKATGEVVGGAVNIVGDITGSQWIKEVGDGVKKASEFAGDTFGQAVDGVWNTAAGIVQNDERKIEKGLGNIGESISRTAKGVYQTAKHTYQNGKEVYEGLLDDDEEKLKNGLANIAKTAAIGTLAIGIFDVIDGIDHGDWIESDQDSSNIGNEGSGSDYSADSYSSHSEVAASIEETTGTHHVRPHWVEGHWSDGQWIEGYWRDGDGNTDVNLTEEQGGGYERTNPDGNPRNNLT